jgi:hypothetical protein
MFIVGLLSARNGISLAKARDLPLGKRSKTVKIDQ